MLLHQSTRQHFCTFLHKPTRHMAFSRPVLMNPQRKLFSGLTRFGSRLVWVRKETLAHDNLMSRYNSLSIYRLDFEFSFIYLNNTILFWLVWMIFSLCHRPTIVFQSFNHFHYSSIERRWLLEGDNNFVRFS